MTDDQLRAWREALAARARDQRRRRVRRRRDPYARAQKALLYRPPHAHGDRDENSDDEHEQ
jgi:hypothetical protein